MPANRTPVSEIILAFDSSSAAIKAEALLQQAAFAPLVMNLPSAIKAGCGICLRLAPALLEDARRLLAENALAPNAYYRREAHGVKSTYTPLEETR